ncbi:MAG: prepilin-type N-terminal cleavage/methylation domain-containing protein [Bacilli bacterium]|nr:prepilin-type N-terminal cleavage/methylation domain-containing protein [Bacilli bacterium]MDD4282578.1 prepilin-type N-terminal cleavage/methylation domain-containing protein [Bacilli bacterium]MDD4718799.1 prepilin-type N-terminal cleavage/methylation domain-containing protein [Bacilli bacterium]
MKNIKAFTLIELLGVLVVLGLIVLVAFPNIITSMKKSTDKEYERFVKDIQLVAESYVDQNGTKFDFNEPGDVHFIELGKLVEEGYLNKKTINPKTESNVDLNTTVIVTLLNDNTKSYEYTGTAAGIHNYVIPNLKVMYDGYKRPTANESVIIWEDLMGNINGELMNGEGLLDWNNNRIKLGGTNNYINVPGSSGLIPFASEVTIEIVYMAFEDSPNGQLSNAGLGHHYYNLYYETGIIRSMVRNSDDTDNLWPEATSVPMTIPNTVHTMTVTMSKNGSFINFNYFGDGKPLTTSSETGLKSGNNDFTIGKDHETNTTAAYIYAFRLYDTALSDEDIKNNYQIDMNRFNWRRQ